MRHGESFLIAELRYKRFTKDSNMKSVVTHLVIIALVAWTGTLAAQTRTWRSHSSSSSLSDINGRVTIDNTPLIDILLHIARESDKPVFIDSALSGSDVLSARHSLELDIHDPLVAMTELLRDSGLTVAVSTTGSGDRWCITRSDKAAGTESTFVGLAEVKTECRLQLAIPIHLEMVPLAMFEPMLEGISGIEVRMDDALDLRGNPWSPLRVSLHNDTRPLREALLESLAREGLTFEVTAGGILIRKSR